MWVAREENGLLRLYTKLPYRYSLGVWRIPDDGDCATISDEDYPQFKNLKWEDEPIEVNIIPTKELKNLYQELFESQTENIKPQLRSKKFFDENFGEVYEED